MTKRKLPIYAAIFCCVFGWLGHLWLGSPEMEEYKRLRASGKLLVDSGWEPFEFVEGNPDRTYIWGETDLTRRFRAAFEKERSRTDGKFSYGPFESHTHYKGTYSPEAARTKIENYYGELPEDCSNFRGSYDCLFYDDNITQKVEFDITEEAWQKWVPRLKEIALENKDADASYFKDNGLHIDFDPSAGSRRLEFKNGRVFFERRVHD